MATTLPLIETIKIDTRKDGAISYAQVRVMLDGAVIATDFRARVGQEPVVIEGDTITVSDEQIEAKRKGQGARAMIDGQHVAREQAELDAVIAKLDDFLARKGASAEAADEVRAYVRAHAKLATETHPSLARDRFIAGRVAIMTRHGLLG